MSAPADGRAVIEVGVRATCQSAGAVKRKPGPVTAFVAVAVVAPPPPPEPHAAAKSARMSSGVVCFHPQARGRSARASERKEPPNMAKTKDKVTDAAGTVKPYVERALHDEDLRENVRNAYQSARTIYDELVARRGVTGVAQRVATDKDIQGELRNAIDELRNAAERVQGTRRRQQVEQHAGRNATLLIAGIALGILFNPVTGPQARKFVADKLFGGGDDFTYQGGNGSAGG